MQGLPYRFRARRGEHAEGTLAALLAAFLLASLLLAGCGGGGGGSSSSSSNGSQAKQGLNNITSGKTPATPGNVGQVAGEYQQLYNQSPNNPDDAAGYAISEAAYAGLQFDNAVGNPSPSVARGSRMAEASATRTARLNNFGQALAIWRVPGLLSKNGSLSWPTATDFLPGGATPNTVSTLPTGPQVQAAMAQLDQSLASCETALSVPLSNSSYTFTLTVVNPQNPSQTESVLLGQAEFNILYTLVATLRGVINPFLAYNVSDPGYDIETNLDTIAPTAMTTDGATIGPSVYMPASPFLTLNANGAQDMLTAQSQLNTACTDGVNAINEVENRDNNGYLLNPGTFVTDNELDSIKAQITTYQGYLTASSEPITLQNGVGQTVTTQIDINKWFTDPPTDLKAFYPTYHVAYSSGQTTLTLSPGDYPDLTFGGLFPSGFPTSGSESNNVLGPDDPTSGAFDLQNVSSDAMSWLSPDLSWSDLDYYFVIEFELSRRPSNR